MFRKTACNVEGNDRGHLALIFSKRANGVGIYFIIFLAREMTLLTVDRQNTHSTEAVFMTTTLLKGCNLSHILIQCQLHGSLLGAL